MLSVQGFSTNQGAATLALALGAISSPSCPALEPSTCSPKSASSHNLAGPWFQTLPYTLEQGSHRREGGCTELVKIPSKHTEQMHASNKSTKHERGTWRILSVKCHKLWNSAANFYHSWRFWRRETCWENATPWNSAVDNCHS
jgi:hypothetical protein